MKCPNCKKQLYTDLVNENGETVCEGCGTKVQVEDEEIVKERLFKQIQEITEANFNTDEEDEYVPIGFIADDVVEQIKRWKQKSEFYDKIRSKISTLVTDIYHSSMGAGLNDKHMEYIKSLLFTIYYEKNQATNMDIYS